MATEKKKKQQSWELSTDNSVSKAHALNEIRNSRMTQPQVRLFTIYLSKINPLKQETREVTFKLSEYARIMEFKTANTTRLKRTAEELLGITVTYWDKTGEYSSDGLKGFVMCQLFKRFRLFKKEDDGEWYVTIDCHDDVLHMMFELKQYLTYHLWNVLPLTKNQQRMYELLKQYEKDGERIMTVKDLREWLWIKPDEYPLWQNFKVRVLDACQTALSQSTDIKFTWEVSGKRGKGGKINALRFIIEENNGYVRQYTLDDYLIGQEPEPEPEQGHIEYEGEPEEFERPDDEIELDEYGVPYDDNYIGGKSPRVERIEFFIDACGGEFSFLEMETIDNKMRDYLTHSEYADQIFCYHYLNDRYNEMQRHDEKGDIKTKRYNYFRGLVGKEI